MYYVKNVVYEDHFPSFSTGESGRPSQVTKVLTYYKRVFRFYTHPTFFTSISISGNKEETEREKEGKKIEVNTSSFRQCINRSLTQT